MPDATSLSQSIAARSRSIQERAAQFRASHAGRATWQMLNTLLPLAAAYALMFWGVSNAWWLTVLLLPVTALLLVRTFIIMHDCAHGSFTASRRANEVIGFITGAITLTPFAQWRRDHALHHASSGDLDRRGHGDIDTLTVDEYRALTRWGRFKYRFYRNAFVMLFLGPLYLMVHYRRTPPAAARTVPTPVALLLATVTSVKEDGTFEWMPPALRAALFWTRTSVSDSCRSGSGITGKVVIAPPLPQMLVGGLPFWSVAPFKIRRTGSVVDAPSRSWFESWKIRESRLPSMIVSSRPAPVMVISLVMSKSPMRSSVSSSPGESIVMRKVPAGTEIESGPGRAFASMMAARREQSPFASAQMPSPSFASTVSFVVFTTKAFANAVRPEPLPSRAMAKDAATSNPTTTKRDTVTPVPMCCAVARRRRECRDYCAPANQPQERVK